ncbi:MAG: acetolactate synthase large subunit [Halobacteriota archaeon]|nr:acetolactate synthase large subunit [Halobacteriota archaeon]
MTKMNGAKAMVKSLKDEGVEVIFGYPGGVLLPLYDELYDSDIRHILVRHEQGAAHAADGYARATGKVGVCLATSGPGATNLVTGIANAYMDSIPIVAITGQVATHMIGNDAFQEANITGITIPITKHNYLVTDGHNLPKYVKEAFHLASTGRPGPVLIDIPTDVFKTESNFHFPKTAQLSGYKPKDKGHSLQIKKAAELIKKSKSPVIFAGGGIILSCAHKELKELAEITGAPVTTTLLGKGGFPETHPLSLGMIGMHGTKYANYAVSDADLLIAVGVRFDDRATGKVSDFAAGAKIIHIDIDPAEIGKTVSVDVPIVGDAKNILKDLLERMTKCDNKEWNEQIKSWKKENPLTYEKDGLKPQFVIEQIYEAFPDAIITTDVGQNQMWAAQYFKYTKPRTLITSGGLGTMGFGLPSAIGAKVGCPEKIVFDIAGDGSFLMKCQELATAVENEIPVKVAILNNGYLGMVRQWQELFYNRRYSHTSLETKTDFVKVAEAFGAVGMRVTDADEVRPAIEKAVDVDKPVVIDFWVSKEENVYPMVPPGGCIKEMLG